MANASKHDVTCALLMGVLTNRTHAMSNLTNKFGALRLTRIYLESQIDDHGYGRGFGTKSTTMYMVGDQGDGRRPGGWTTQKT